MVKWILGCSYLQWWCSSGNPGSVLPPGSCVSLNSDWLLPVWCSSAAPPLLASSSLFQSEAEAEHSVWLPPQEKPVSSFLFPQLLPGQTSYISGDPQSPWTSRPGHRHSAVAGMGQRQRRGRGGDGVWVCLRHGQLTVYLLFSQWRMMWGGVLVHSEAVKPQQRGWEARTTYKQEDLLHHGSQKAMQVAPQQNTSTIQQMWFLQKNKCTTGLKFIHFQYPKNSSHNTK